MLSDEARHFRAIIGLTGGYQGTTSDCYLESLRRDGYVMSCASRMIRKR